MKPLKRPKPAGPANDARAGTAHPVSAMPVTARAKKPVANNLAALTAKDVALRQAAAGARSRTDPAVPHGVAPEDHNSLSRSRRSAATLDAAVPEAERAQVIKEQQQAYATAQARASASSRGPSEDAVTAKEAYGEYWEDHEYYVDPKTQTVYYATYNASTGTITGERFDDPDPDSPPPPIPPVKDKARVPKKKTPHAGPGGLSGGGSAGSAGAAGSDPQQPDPVAATNPSAALSGQQRPSTTSQADSFDTRLEVTMDNTQVRTVSSRYGNADGGGSDTTTSHETVNGTLREQTNDHSEWALDGASGSSYRTRSSTINGQGYMTHVASSDSRSDGHGTNFASSSEFTMDQHGKPVDSTVTTTARQHGHRASETEAIHYEKGLPKTGTVTQELQVGNTTETGSVAITFDGRDDVFGQPRIASIEQTGTRGDRLDMLYGDGLDASEPRFAFGSVVSDGRGDQTVYVSHPGVRLKQDHMEVYVEGADLSLDAIGGPHTQAVLDTINASPPELLKSTDSIDAMLGQSPDDVAAGKRYGIDNFVSGANAANGHINFFGSSINDIPAMWHELGHINGDDGGPVDPDKWDDAIAADRATRKALIDTPGATIDWSNAERSEFIDQSGVTGYASDALDGPSETTAEDWAESTQLWIDSQQNGGIATMTMADGTTRQLTFEEIFPERAKLLQDHYGQLTIPPATDTVPVSGKTSTAGAAVSGGPGS